MLIIGILGIVTSLLAVQIKAIKAEYAIYVSLCGCMIIFFYSLKGIDAIMELLNRMSEMGNVEQEYFKTLMKITGVAFVAEIASDISKDCGFQTLAKQVQVFGKISILVMSLPVFSGIVELIGELLK